MLRHTPCDVRNAVAAVNGGALDGADRDPERDRDREHDAEEEERASLESMGEPAARPHEQPDVSELHGTVGTRRVPKVPAPDLAPAGYPAEPTMKRKPTPTKRERKAAAGGPRPAGQPRRHTHNHGHIHCIACGKHLDERDFEAPATATTITCDHGSTFPTCVKCMAKSTALVKEHDETNQPVKVASAWH